MSMDYSVHKQSPAKANPVVANQTSHREEVEFVVHHVTHEAEAPVHNVRADFPLATPERPVAQSKITK